MVSDQMIQIYGLDDKSSFTNKTSGCWCRFKGDSRVLLSNKKGFWYHRTNKVQDKLLYHFFTAYE